MAKMTHSRDPPCARAGERQARRHRQHRRYREAPPQRGGAGSVGPARGLYRHPLIASRPVEGIARAEFAANSVESSGMPHADFVHLRVHSAYSLSEGAIKIKELIELCKAQAMPAVAVDRHRQPVRRPGVPLAARDAGVQPIIGCQLGSPREPEPRRRQRGGRQPPRTRWCCWPRDEDGYRNLLKLVEPRLSRGRARRGAACSAGRRSTAHSRRA